MKKMMKEQFFIVFNKEKFRKHFLGENEKAILFGGKGYFSKEPD